MPRVDFYLLNIPEKEGVYRLLCRLVEKAYQQKNSAYIYASSLEEARCLDDLLWTFRDTSFIPHQIEETRTVLPSVSIVIDRPQQLGHSILFNLGQAVPGFLSECSRIIEMVSAEKTDKMQARKKYRDYKAQGCSLTTHNIQLPC